LNNNQKNVEFQLIDIFEDELYLKYTKDWNINVKLMLKEMDKEIQMNLDENHYTHRKEDFILLKKKSSIIPNKEETYKNSLNNNKKWKILPM
jgi:hypothetical protein